MRIMKKYSYGVTLLCGLVLLGAGSPAHASIFVQCPGDLDGSADWEQPGETQPAHTKCLHLSGGDGYITMADGKPLYIFGFSNLTGLATTPAPPLEPDNIMGTGALAAAFPAPILEMDEGDEFYLTLTNVGMVMRPDLFDPHTVHYHGFPQSSTIFDGLPESGIAIGMGASLTYYYKNNEPGTYMYHCHVEATEHMQMGMLGSLYVRPAQDGTPYVYKSKTYTKFVYNDGDGSTGYDVVVPVQIGSMDSVFHDASEAVQPLPFAMMRDNYPMLNGRGYPDTVVAGTLPAPAENGGKESQFENTLIQASPGDRVLLRISNLDITRYYTLATLGVSMEIVGKDAKLLRGPDGKNLYYKTNSVTLGGGESLDAIITIPGNAIAGTRYFLYTTNLNYLNNDTEEYGGMMSEISVN